MEGDDPDTEPLRVPGAETSGQDDGWRGRAGRHGELFPRSRTLSKRWQIERSYEFATSESALMLVACAAAVGTVTGVWPAVELQHRRVRVRLRLSAAGWTLTAPEQRVWWELEAWARKLGGELVAARL